MNSKGQDGDKTGYLVILLLVVGLTGFSTAMNDLTQVKQSILDASQLVAQSSDRVAPTAITPTLVKLETCESNKSLPQSVPSIELPWLDQVEDETESSVVVPRRAPQANKEKFVPAPLRPSAAQIAKLEKLRRFDFDAKQFEFIIPGDDDTEADRTITLELPVPNVKAKTRKHGNVRINPRDREMLLKTLNRSINLRIAS
jgi:hypothetical protein